MIEVRAPNRIGVLHRITKALAELGLDIRHATVQTLGEDVVDTFYVQGRNGRRIDGRRSTARRSSGPCSTPCPDRRWLGWRRVSDDARRRASGRRVHP